MLAQTECGDTEGAWAMFPDTLDTIPTPTNPPVQLRGVSGAPVFARYNGPLMPWFMRRKSAWRQRQDVQTAAAAATNGLHHPRPAGIAPIIKCKNPVAGSQVS